MITEASSLKASLRPAGSMAQRDLIFTEASK